MLGPAVTRIDNAMSTIDDIGGPVVDDLTFDPDIDASEIAVENRDGNVVLVGNVPSYPQYLEAAAAARRVAGAKDAHNHLEVALPRGDHRDDSRLTAEANDALALGHSVAVEIEATARDGVITLTGEARCGAERAAAETMLAALTGIRGVTNYVQIRADAAPMHQYGEPMEQA